MNQKYKNKFPFNIYENMIIEQTGEELNKEELEYMLKFSKQINYVNSSTELYNYCLFLLSKYPEFIINFLVFRKAKKILNNSNAPDSIKKLYKQIAHITIVSAMSRVK
ncbi:hypothetical protein Q6A77_06850 [Aliarcobacter skirrowii]|uniref:hypothetical protein n=1 Tax=Aliarcobacter skirrowii TaxID=28200 RepID=UPI0029B36073|nr:hypothetical protein [Aliarcobacter skirrowii]MDX4058385.1 hypothetical protein [Aliarcobacter skirrowii]